MKAQIAFLLISLSLISCKNDKSVDDLKVVETKIEKSKVTLELDMIVPEDDTFQIYYTEDGLPNCTEENSVKAEVKGSSTSQKILFEIPEDKAINYIRIDIGRNPKQGELKVNRFVYTYFDKKLDLKGNAFFQYYSPNQFFTLDFPNSTLIPSKDKKDYDPILYALEPLSPALEKMLTKK
ncbi:hypothetical protein [Flavobacterium sp.]|uniref:hypothetical protein n=1 Tax=Flavobacterium sp. TaxID=239 RepID=UPI002606FBD6|nr:hypothetical protein [Flavobacterium sp.]